MIERALADGPLIGNLDDQGSLVRASFRTASQPGTSHHMCLLAPCLPVVKFRERVAPLLLSSSDRVPSAVDSTASWRRYIFGIRVAAWSVMCYIAALETCQSTSRTVRLHSDLSACYSLILTAEARTQETMTRLDSQLR